MSSWPDATSAAVRAGSTPPGRCSRWAYPASWPRATPGYSTATRINVGLLPVECKIEAEEGDILSVDFDQGIDQERDPEEGVEVRSVPAVRAGPDREGRPDGQDQGGKEMFKVAVLPGDGIGPEVVNEGMKVLNAAVRELLGAVRLPGDGHQLRAVPAHREAAHRPRTWSS